MESTDPLQPGLDRNPQEVLLDKKELLEMKKYLQILLENVRDMVFAADVNGTLVLFSSGAEKILGYPCEEAEGRFARTLALDPSEFDKLTAIAQEEGSVFRREFPFQHKTGRTIYCDVTLNALANTLGQTVATVGVCRDVTRWKDLQEDLIRVDRLAEIGRTASGIIHEINNPIAVIGEIAGWIGTVAADTKGIVPADREEIKKAVQDIKEQTQRCRSITHQVLSFVRESEPSRSSVDIHRILKETASFLNPDIKYKEIDLVLNLMEAPLLMESDKQMLEQVLVNLMSNAVYAVKEKWQRGGRIEIETQKNDSMIEIRISDNGVGISEENQKRIYDLFFTTKPPGKGTGLGLPICQNIIKKLGGNLSFKTRAGEGTTFFIRLPAS